MPINFPTARGVPGFRFSPEVGEQSEQVVSLAAFIRLELRHEGALEVDV